VATLTIHGALTDATIEAGVAGFGLVIEASVDAKYSVRTNTGGAGLVYLQAIDDTGTGSDDPLYESYTNTGSAPAVSVTTGSGGLFEAQINMQAAERQARSIEDFFEDEGYSYSGGIDVYEVKVTARRPSGAIVATATVRKFPQTSGFPNFDVNTLRVPRRRLVILDIDGLRWDVFRKHLWKVRDAQADLDRTYRFLKPYDATQHTVIGLGQDLRSALAVLCFHPGMGRTEVRLARAPFPSYTFPSHGTMFTGLWPNLHGIAGNAYVKRDASFQWKPRNWEALPDGPALQGYCTGSDDILTGIDHWWDGLAESDANDCPDRNRGLVSDLPAFVTVYDRAAETAGLRSLVIHNFYHSAAQPWTDAGKDIWWHMTNPEVRTIKDVCSDEDADEAEPVDSAAFVKAELALGFVPHTIRATDQGPFPYSTDDFNYADLVDKLSGEKKTAYSHLEGQSDSSGGPDILTIYLASVDQASHKRGAANQATYLAWFDHRLALFVKALMAKDPIRFNNTVFALVADHGHSDLVEKPPGPAHNDLAVREEICRLRFGNQKVEELRRLAQLYPYLNYRAWSRTPSRMSPSCSDRG
jgi:predicted AlkP superfamily pyrophosphatase or phosphodiesterase